MEDKALDVPLTLENVNRLSIKEIYGAFLATPPPPKIMEKMSLDWGRVWGRLNDPIISRESLDICFSVLHDIYPTKIRLNKCNQHPTGFCARCPQVPETAVHLFAECRSIIHLWIYIKNLLIRNDIICHVLVDDKLCLFFDSDVESAKVSPYLFFISNYILFVHHNKYQNATVKDLKAFLMHRKRANLNIVFKEHFLCILVI